MNWEPAHADHAIDRAAASFYLSGLDASAVDDLVVAARKAGAKHGLVDRAEFVEPVEIPQGVQVKLSLDGSAPTINRRVVFRRLDADGNLADELSVGTKMIAIATLRYRRWANFQGMIKDMLENIHAGCPNAQVVKAVRLEYIDRFVSTAAGGDHFEVINQNSKFLPAVLRDKKSSLHAHSGWFEFDSDTIRTLINANIDVADTPSDSRRRIGILTLGHIEALDSHLDLPFERLESLHNRLKTMFGDITTSAVAARVALNG